MAQLIKTLTSKAGDRSLRPGSDAKVEGKNSTKFSSDFHTCILTHTHTYRLVRTFSNCLPSSVASSKNLDVHVGREEG